MMKRLLKHPEQKRQLIDKFGDQADKLVVEALIGGVVLSPLAKYDGYNVRILSAARCCRLGPGNCAAQRSERSRNAVRQAEHPASRLTVASARIWPVQETQHGDLYWRMQ